MFLRYKKVTPKQKILAVSLAHSLPPKFLKQDVLVAAVIVYFCAYYCI